MIKCIFIRTNCNKFHANVFFVQIGGAALDLNAVAPKPKKWIQDITWLNLIELSKLNQFNQLPDQVTSSDRVC